MCQFEQAGSTIYTRLHKGCRNKIFPPLILITTANHSRVRSEEPDLRDGRYIEVFLEMKEQKGTTIALFLRNRSSL